jgi:general stress protein 26
MALVTASEETAFFEDVNEAAKKAVWCAVATVAAGEARVRIVHPTFEGSTLWFATGATSPKAAQISENQSVDVQFQVAPPDFVHLLVRGSAAIIDDPGEKKRVWEVIDYDLTNFWPGGPEDPNYAPVKITPTRVELSKMFGTLEKRIWRADS